VPDGGSCELKPLAKKAFAVWGRNLACRFMSGKIWIGRLREISPRRPAIRTTPTTTTAKIKRK
jgi:hypothetical protein